MICTSVKYKKKRKKKTEPILGISEEAWVLKIWETLYLTKHGPWLKNVTKDDTKQTKPLKKLQYVKSHKDKKGKRRGPDELQD